MNFTHGLKNYHNSCSGQRDRTLARKSLLITKTVPLTVESCKLTHLPFLSLFGPGFNINGKGLLCIYLNMRVKVSPVFELGVGDLRSPLH
jgi:hypothetical protein